MNLEIEFAYRMGVKFVGNELQLRTNSVFAADVMEFLFQWHFSSNVSGSCRKLDVVKDSHGDGFALLVDGQLAALVVNGSELPVALMQLAQRQLICKEEQHAMLHAALLVKNGCGLLLPAAAGSGKTTLTAWLVGHGYGLLSDELAAIDGVGIADGLTRPLNIKLGSQQVIRGLDWMREPLAQSRLSGGVTLIPWKREAAKDLKVALTVCPLYVPGAPFGAEVLTPGRFAKELLGSLLNTRNLPKHGLAFSKGFAGTCPAYRITFSKLQDVSDWLAGTEQALSAQISS